MPPVPASVIIDAVAGLALLSLLAGPCWLLVEAWRPWGPWAGRGGSAASVSREFIAFIGGAGPRPATDKESETMSAPPCGRGPGRVTLRDAGQASLAAWLVCTGVGVDFAGRLATPQQGRGESRGKKAERHLMEWPVVAVLQAAAGCNPRQKDDNWSARRTQAAWAKWPVCG